MKIKNMQLKNHPVLKNLRVDFSNDNGEAQNLIVIAGTNGSGKTNLLEAIYDYFEQKITFKNIDFGVNNELELSNEEQAVINKYSLKYQQQGMERFFEHLTDYEYYKKSKLYSDKGVYVGEIAAPPKIIYMPTEINFSEVKNADNKYKYEYKFLNKIDSDIVKDVPSYLATKVKLMQKNNEDLSYKEIKEKVSEEINEIFQTLELDVKMIGFTPDERDLPLFSNSYREVFHINGLSSGEKQLFIRALALKMVEAENAIILIDEPEISLHPKWQQRILKVYENIGKNNQVIIATHSPHILGSVSNENIRIMKKTPEGIEIKRYGELSYGQSIENILENAMELEEIIAPEIAQKLEKLHVMLKKQEYDGEEFKNLHEELRNILGPHNDQLMLLNLQLSVAKGKRGK